MDSNALISASAGLLGVIAGGFLTTYAQSRARLNKHYRDQLQKFYSPILGLREEIRAKSESRARLQGMAETKFQDIAREATDKEIADYSGVGEYGNQQFKEEMIPTYEEMAKLFKERMYLAEPSTRSHYSKLVDLVEIWKRFLANTLPCTLANEIVRSAIELRPFYEDVEKNFAQLQKKLSSRWFF